MGMTIAEKIVARAAGVSEAHANDIHTVELDYLMSNDGTTHLTIDMYNNLKHPHRRKKCAISQRNTGSPSMRAPVYVIR